MAGSAKKEKEHNDKSRRWYVIQVTGFEKKVAKMLQERIRAKGLQDKFGQIFVPEEEVWEMVKGQKRKIERKFFPGYVFVQMEMDDEAWHFVNSIPGVKGFRGGTSGRPMPISDKEMNIILDRQKEGVDKPRPKVLFEPGEVVLITEGPFADFNGIVEDVNYEKSRLRVSVLIFGRSTPVELEFGQVEKA
jgi:transcriptional antiterminator NusG